MSFDWQHYLDLAKELLTKPAGSSNVEARLRSAISRAYYTAYHIAQDYLKKRGPYTAETGTYSHKEVITQYFCGTSDTHNDIASDLNILFDYRKKADYSPDSKWLSTDLTKMCIQLAGRVLRNINQVSKEENK